MKLIKKHIINILFIILLLVIVFVPDAKSMLIQGLIKVGFYTPKIEETNASVSNLNGIQFKNVKGELVDLGDLKGKVIFINFWATWCPPCRAEMPSISKLYNQFKDDKNVVFIFADADGNLPKSSKFMLDRKFEMPVYKIESDMPKEIFESALPTTVIFDKQGRLSFRNEGIADYSNKKFVDFLNKLKNM